MYKVTKIFLEICKFYKVLKNFRFDVSVSYIRIQESGINMDPFSYLLVTCAMSPFLQAGG